MGIMAAMNKQTERLLASFRDTLKDQLGDNLASLLLFGSATGDHYSEEGSDLNLLIVLEQTSVSALDTIRQALKDHKQAAIDPLILARAEVDRLPAAFPIETVDMQAAHRVLSGDDLIQDLSVHRDAIRRQLSTELLGKSMRLRAVYTGAKKANDKELRTMLSQAVSPFGTLMRALLYVGDPHFAELAPPREFLEVLAQLEARFELDLDGFRRGSLIKSGQETPERAELIENFDRILAETDALQNIADSLDKESS